jgi:hypothetical protein
VIFVPWAIYSTKLTLTLGILIDVAKALHEDSNDVAETYEARFDKHWSNVKMLHQEKRG